MNVVPFPLPQPVATALPADPFAGLLKGYYGAIVADPPWHFKARTAIQSVDWSSPRHIERHYPTMSLDDIKAMPVRDLAAKEGCHLFLWATGPCLRQAFEVMDAWGFRYSAMAFTWIKLKKSYDRSQLRAHGTIDSDFHVGLGLTTRHNAEFCLLGRRGSPKRISKSVRELIVSPRREHSRKPIEAFDRVREYCTGPYLDMFSREVRPGWDSFGDQVGKFGGGK